MNAEVNTAPGRSLHPLTVDNESRQRLAHWLKSNGSRQTRALDQRRQMTERYPSGFFSEAEVQALCEAVEESRHN